MTTTKKTPPKSVFANVRLAVPGVLTIGVDESPPPPFCFGLPGEPEFEGFEVDLTRELAARIGLEPRYTSELWSRILEDLREGRIDMICTAATVTPERARIVDFSDPYLDTALGIVVRAGGDVRGMEDLGGRIVGARVATVAEEAARGRTGAARIVTFDLNTDAYRALQEGEVDAVVDDVGIGGYFARSLPGLHFAGTIPGTESTYAFMLARGNDALRQAVNRALCELREDGTHERLVRRWLEPAAGTTTGAEPAGVTAGPVVRIWRGRTRASDADAYVDYLRETGVRDYRSVAGNLGVRILRRMAGGEAEFLVLSTWESLEAVRSFAGEDLERAVYYPEDDRFLLEKEPHVRHYEVVVDASS